MKGHAAMDMSAQGDGSFLRRLLSGDGFTAVADVFVVEWAGRCYLAATGVHPRGHWRRTWSGHAKHIEHRPRQDSRGGA